MRHAIVDFETTGLTQPSVADLHKQPKIIEVGLMIVERGVPVDELSQLVWPEEDVSAEITKITGITNDMLKGRPTFSEIVNRVTSMLKGCECFWAHNAPFDRACLEYELQRLGRAADFPWPPQTICTVQEYVHEFGRRPKLTELYELKMGTPLAQTHRALDDVKALAEILFKEGLLL